MMGTKSVEALERWSAQEGRLPVVGAVRAIHVYDFDNTLFKSPLPNKQIWTQSTLGTLQTEDYIHNGGWWHNPVILSSAGQGAQVEEGRAWEGGWNEKIVDLVRLSMEDQTALTVLLTGRGQINFADLLQRMVGAKGLEFDMICLKPKTGPSGESFSSTMNFKQALLRDLVLTYSGAEEIRIYEDRPRHTQGFREFLVRMNAGFGKNSPRGPITASVIQVTEQDMIMEASSEVSTVQQMINNHNAAILAGEAPKRAIPLKIGRNVIYTGYMISPEDSARLQTLVRLPPDNLSGQIRPLATDICISPKGADNNTMSRVGGVGAKVRWKVTGLGILDNRIWAARISPIDGSARVWTDKTPAHVVLAIRGAARASDSSRIGAWQPVAEQDAIQFETTVGERALLTIESETTGAVAQQNGSYLSDSTNNRKHGLDAHNDDEFPPLGATSRPQKSARNGNNGYQNGKPQQGRPQYPNNRGGGIGFAASRGGGNSGGRGGRGNHRGGGGGGQRGGQRGGRGGGGQRGRGGQGYRSLDAGVQGYGGGSMDY
ncbi:hypothetical protein B0A48_12624 [Cryoendolithus antarcticus]|uniref:Swiss Army Knife RNA repair protein HAD domain-containing protein n=1 Tax=Cryoendolithus antarcticus TaxID=1507870 RepID=A0A1V8SRD7_9PEZI|nr:hypothetical protein B0A48_12624 [Cryoendolithus antarcticus]